MNALEDALRTIIREEVHAALAADRPQDDGLLLVSLEEAARRLDCSYNHLREKVLAGELDVAASVGQGRKVTVASLRAYVARQIVRAA